MDCERFGYLLDAYIDGEMNDEDMRQFMDHADSCEDCRMALREAELLRDVMKDMDDDVAVPLQVQAAWRNAVRAEAKKIRMRRVMKFAYAAAAALVLVIGCTIGLNAVNEKSEPAAEAPMLKRAAVNEAALIARDGEAAAATADYSASYTAMKKIETEDYDSACMTVELLCQEYSGAFSAEAASAEGEKSAISYRIELPYEYMSDFLSAASRIGTEIESVVEDAAQETAVILIQICEK